MDNFFTHLDGRFPIAPHEHVAVLYRGRAAAFRFAGFLAEGIKNGDLCHYLAPATFHAEMLRHLRALEPDLERHLRSESLRLHAGLAEFAALRDRLQRTFARAERTRAPAIRWLEEGSWPEWVGFPMPQFFEFHAILNYQVKHYPSAALCQYALDTIEPHHLFSAIAVHRHLLVEDAFVRDNPFYIPAEKFLPLSPEEREHDLARVFREVGFDVGKLLEALAGYGRLRREAPQHS